MFEFDLEECASEKSDKERPPLVLMPYEVKLAAYFIRCCKSILTHPGS